MIFEDFCCLLDTGINTDYILLCDSRIVCEHFYGKSMAISLWNRVAKRKRLAEIAHVNEPLETFEPFELNSTTNEPCAANIFDPTDWPYQTMSMSQMWLYLEFNHHI